MSLTFRTSLGLLLAAAVCPACELVLGDIPDKASLTGGGSAGDGSTGSAGGTGTTTSSDASNAGIGGANGSGGSFGAGGETSGSGATTGAGGIGGNGGLGGSVGTAGADGGAGKGGSGGSAGNAGAGGKGGAGGSGGTAGASGSAGSSGGGGNGGGPRDAGSDADPCDLDGDGYRSRTCSGGNDCDDNAALVHPGQLNFSEDPTHVGGTDFDFDCNGLPQPQFKAVNCAGLGLTCNQSGSGFLGTMAPACGQTGRFGHCIVNGLNCDEQIEQAVKKMPCK
jgi:hypothetical protein